MPHRTTPPPVARSGLLLEREQELEAFAAAIAAAGRGAGRIAVVRAPPGAGKTQLIGHARHTARKADLQVLEARGVELEQGFAFGVVRQLLEPVVVGADEEQRAALFADAAALAARIFDSGGADGGSGGGADASFATLHGLYWLVVHLADRAPVLVSVDDCQWVDAQSLGFLNYLAHRVDGLAVTIVLAGRPAADTVWEQLAALPEAVVLQPQPLSAEAVGVLVRARLGSDAQDDLCAACHRATGGNPLFLRELLGELDGPDDVPPADAVTAVGPSAVSRLVLHRLARLGPDVTELARAAAVLGDGAELPVAADVAGLSEDAARRAADALVRADMLEATERLSYMHPIVAAAIYEDLAPGERQRRHAAAARTLAERGAPAERVAAHLPLTAPAGDASRVATLRTAAASTAGRGAPEAAAAYLRRALHEPPPPAELAPVLAELGRYELAAMQLTDAAEHLRAAVTSQADATLRADAASRLARCAVVAGGDSAEAAAATLEALIAELEPDDLPRALALGSDLLILSATVPRLRAALPERLATFRRRAANDPPFAAVARIHGAHEALVSGETAAAAAVGEVHDALAGGLPAEADANTLYLALTVLMLGERYEIAMRWLDAGLELARRSGHTARQSIVHGQRATIALARGALDEAQVEAETGLALIDDRHAVLPQLGAVLTAVGLERGDLDAAAAATARSDALGEAEDRLFLDQYLTSRGRLRIAQGHVRDGVADLLRCGERREALGLRWPSDWRAYAAPALATLGESEQAAALAREQLSLARHVGAAGALGRALRASAGALGGDEGLELLEEAVTVLEPTPARLELAHALLALGGEQTRRKRRREGREHLRLALELALKSGAIPLAERARTELTAGGGRPPRLQLTGLAALTPSERRVCELAATQQLTNRAIAQQLFVTEKTIELHLGNAYRKLGIRSRFQLAGALGG